jgi:hypothetical protein
MGGLGGIGRSRARVFDAERPDTTFADVAGSAGAKREVSEVVDFLKHPERYRGAGADVQAPALPARQGPHPPVGRPRRSSRDDPARRNADAGC